MAPTVPAVPDNPRVWPSVPQLAASAFMDPKFVTKAGALDMMANIIPWAGASVFH